MFFDDMLLTEVRERNDIVDIVSMYTDLKRNGNRYTGLCPFHKEKTPSFSVNAESQLFYCFGCHEGGNIINFVEKINNLDFIEAVKYLAERAGIALPEEGGELPKEFKVKKNIYEVNKRAAAIFHNNLINSKAGMDYLKERGLDMHTIKNFGLGFAGNNYDELYKTLLSEGFDKNVIIKSGVCLNKNDKCFDFFRNRVIFPVIDLRGNVIAFGGRVMDGSLPKYLNTGETEVFKKRQNLFALNIAKNSGKDYVILAEGYMDVITLHKYGFNSAVASLGTSFCEEHAALLKRYTKKVVICYDNDTAGQNAVKKAAEFLIFVGITVKVAKLSGGKDPDEILKKYGEDYFSNIIKNSPLYMDYLLEKEKENLDLDSMEDKIKYARSASAHLAILNDPIEREIYIKKLAKELDISEEILKNEYIKQVTVTKKAEDKKREVKENFARKSKSEKDKIKDALDVCEGELVNIMVNNPVYYKRLAGLVGNSYFSSEIYNHSVAVMKELFDLYGKFSVNMILDRLKDEEKSKIAMLSVKDLKYELNDNNVRELIKRINMLKQKSKIDSANSLEDLNSELKNLRNNNKWRKG